jgi:hypothetical protein
MEDMPSKFILCVLPTQSGKTFTVISQINKKIEEDTKLGRSIHIVYTMNTLLNNAQFAKRLKEIEITYGKGSVCVISSEKNNIYTHVKSIDELKGLCFDISTCPRVIVMCSNKKMYNNGFNFLKTINTLENRNHILRAFVYYDELHQYINTLNLRDIIEDIHSLDIVVNITALTATPYVIWQSTGFWSKLKLIQLDNYNDYNYVGYTDMKFICIDEPDNPFIDYIDFVLKKYTEILANNTRTFIPAKRHCVSHNNVRDIVLNNNKQCVVIIINGSEKIIQYNDDLGMQKRIELISKNKEVEELSETISRLVIEYKLQNRPIVYTGFICISMGQTLTCKSLGSFTSAIFAQSSLPNEQLYQLFGRITGRMKDWDNKYIQTCVYCQTDIMNICCSMETIAIDLALCNNGDNVTQNDYIDPLHQMGKVGQDALKNIRKKDKSIAEEIIIEHRIFDSQEEAKIFAKDKFDHILKHRPSNEAPKTLRDRDGTNPTIEYVLSRKWGFSKDKSSPRMCITKNDIWLVYWKPSTNNVI